MEQSAKTKERFSETNESFTMLEAINEAKRCLHCKAPQCSKGCPISQDIPDWIHELSMGNLGNAMHIINGKSNLPAVCGRVCPHERQCEGHCVLGKKGRPVANWNASLPTSTATCSSSASGCRRRRVDAWR